MFLIRNLAFNRTSMAFFNNNKRTIPLLLKTLNSPSLEACAYASSALWTITYHERRVASLLKKAGGLPIIQAAEASTREKLRMAEEALQGCRVSSKGESLTGQAYIENMLKHIEQVWYFIWPCCIVFLPSLLWLFFHNQSCFCCNVKNFHILKLNPTNYWMECNTISTSNCLDHRGYESLEARNRGITSFGGGNAWETFHPWSQKLVCEHDASHLVWCQWSKFQHV